MNDILSNTIKRLFDIDIDVVVTRPNSEFGDYTTNIAFQLSKVLKQSPPDIAATIVKELNKYEDFADITIAGPGFINIWLSDTVLISAVKKEPTPQLKDKTIVFEYSCPNAFKELHTGHLYQTVFGDIASRLLIINGANLKRTSFGGDVGLHVAKCLWGMVDTIGSESPEELQTISRDAFKRAQWISENYVRGAKAYQEDETIKNQIDELNKTIYGFHNSNDHETPLAQIYWITRQWSFDYFNAFYSRIKVDQLHYYAESETAPIGLTVVKEQLSKGKLKHSDGAVVFEGDTKNNLHTRVFITSKGLPTYETKDIGVIWMEKEDYDFEHRYILTGNDQREYMRVVFAAAETFRPELTDTMTHMTNGTVKFADGKKMSSRLGNVTRALDVIDIVKTKVKEIIDNEALIDDVVLGAIKYAFARYKLGGDISFNIEETVSLQGNSGPYIQYAYARATRILEKSSIKARGITTMYNEDRLLVRKLGEYSEIIELAARNLEPHHICNYLFELAQEFNRYYEKNIVIGSDKEAHRLSIVKAYADTLKKGLEILGIVAPKQM